jgi:hypothetical protein
MAGDRPDDRRQRPRPGVDDRDVRDMNEERVFYYVMTLLAIAITMLCAALFIMGVTQLVSP